MPSGFLCEDNGNRSSMRLMSMISLIMAGSCAAYTLIAEAQDKPIQTGRELTLIFVIGAFAPKAIQKFAEQKIAAYPQYPQVQTPQPAPQPQTREQSAVIEQAPPQLPAATPSPIDELRAMQSQGF